ncbi:MAG: DNA double-strand break repair nuclease NurA, partial [Dehalococcoidia bacterium]|nr:DNA double-strand break repair nuclease NurA [Dehalococcoidia bacterium]
TSRLASAIESKQQKLEIALATMVKHNQDLPALRDRIASAMSARTSTWLAAGIIEDISIHTGPPAVPVDFTVIAADGSHIDVDRHYSTHCFLINIGLVKLSYGRRSGAYLSSSPFLYYDDNDVVITPPSGDEQPEPVQGPLLGAKRSVDECGALVRAAKELDGTEPAICLLDGSLVLWGLTGTTYPKFVTDILLRNGLIKHFSAIESLSSQRTISLASYISFPRNTEVVNALRLALCPFDKVDCDRNCPPGIQKKPCNVIDGLLDRDIFRSLLGHGERSAVFASLSSIVTSLYGQHQICFFYLNTGEEIARVELPVWAASNKDILSITHAIIIDQCRRGNGYPVALSEAHEQAVITGRDRDEFWQLVEESLARRHITLDTSLKSQSKRTRWL